MRTTTTIPTTLKVLMNHIYELHKGVRHMVLFTRDPMWKFCIFMGYLLEKQSAMVSLWATARQLSISASAPLAVSGMPYIVA